MTFKTQIVEDAKNVFLNTDEFSESIVYTPKAGWKKTISALVVRERLNQMDQGLTQAPGRQFEVFVANDATDGVTSVVKGQDKVSLPINSGEDSVDFSVVDIISKDDAMWHLLVQR